MISVVNMRLIVKVSVFEKVEVTKTHCLEDTMPVQMTSVPIDVSNCSDSVILS